MTTPQLLVEHALDTSTADACSVVVGETSTANLRWAHNTLTTNGAMSSCLVTVVSHVRGAGGTAVGVVTQPASSLEDAADIVRRADATARDSAPAEDAADIVTGDAAAGWELPSGATSVEVFHTVARDLGESFRRARLEDRLLYGYVEHTVVTTYLGTSGGLRLRHEQPTGHIGVTGKPRDLSTSAWVGQATDDFTDVDVMALDDELVRRIGWAARRIDLPAGRYETVLPPTAVADLMIYAYFVASARDAAEGRTVFSAPGGGIRIGEQLARAEVSLFSDPGHPGLQARPFVAARGSDSSTSVFDNGLAAGRAEWIHDGVLRELPTSRHTAATTGVNFAPKVDNLVLTVDGGSGSVTDLVGSSERALLVTCLWYIRQVDAQELLLTGLTRDGIYLVEHGEVVGAVNNFRFNESPISLLSRFTEAGSTGRAFSREWGDYFPRTAMPALRIPDFTMSSVSQAN